MEEYETQNESLILERDELKRKVQKDFARVKVSTSPSFIKDKVSELRSCLKSLEKLDKSILTSLSKYKTLKEFYLTESDTALDYKIDLEEQIAIVFDNLDKPISPLPDSENSVPSLPSSRKEASSNTSVRTLPNLNLLRSTKEPPIQIGKFEGNEDDKLAFSHFLSKFKAVFDNNPIYSDEEKFIHLLGSLGKIAFEMVRHLTPEGSNYAVALDILKAEFLDKEYITESIFTRLLQISPPPDNDLMELKAFLTEVKALTYDLKSYGLDCLVPDTVGFRMLSTAIGLKLPRKFKTALIDKTLSNYPNIVDIFENASVLIKRLEVTQKQHVSKHDNSAKNQSGKNKNGYYNDSNNSDRFNNGKFKKGGHFYSNRSKGRGSW